MAFLAFPCFLLLDSHPPHLPPSAFGIGLRQELYVSFDAWQLREERLDVPLHPRRWAAGPRLVARGTRDRGSDLSSQRTFQKKVSLLAHNLVHFVYN